MSSRFYNSENPTYSCLEIYIGFVYACVVFSEIINQAKCVLLPVKTPTLFIKSLSNFALFIINRVSELL